MSDASTPIGVFDSGLGGLSVLLEIRKLLPSEDVVYYGDSAHCPYGGRPPEYILNRSTAVVGYLVQRGVKLVVVACNTASSVVLSELRSRFHVPIVGMVPAVKPAAAATRTGKIGILATPRTVTGESLAALIREHARGTKVINVPAPRLVELVEEGRLEGPEVDAALQPLVCPLLERGVDTLVLGCTHYPFLHGAIRRMGGPELAIIDSGEAVARRTRDVLDKAGLLCADEGEGSFELVTSGDPEHVAKVASRLLRQKVAASHLPL